MFVKYLVYSVVFFRWCFEAWKPGKKQQKISLHLSLTHFVLEIDLHLGLDLGLNLEPGALNKSL